MTIPYNSHYCREAGGRGGCLICSSRHPAKVHNDSSSSALSHFHSPPCDRPLPTSFPSPLPSPLTIVNIISTNSPHTPPHYSLNTLPSYLTRLSLLASRGTPRTIALFDTVIIYRKLSYKIHRIHSSPLLASILFLNSYPLLLAL